MAKINHDSRKNGATDSHSSDGSRGYSRREALVLLGGTISAVFTGHAVNEKLKQQNPARWTREGDEYDMTEMLASNTDHGSLGGVCLTRDNQSLSKVVADTYAKQLGTAFSPDVQRELTEVLAALNFVKTDTPLREGMFIYAPPLGALIDRSNSSSELAQPNNELWYSRITKDLKELAYLEARSDVIQMPSQHGFTHVIGRDDRSWVEIVQATYPELREYPKTTEYLTAIVAWMHGADAQLRPEEGRIIYLPRFDSIVKQGEKPRVLLELTAEEVVARMPSVVQHTASLERDVYDRYIRAAELRKPYSPEPVATTPPAEPVRRQREVRPLTPDSALDLNSLTPPALPRVDPIGFQLPEYMTSSEEGRALVRSYEAFEPKPYYCCANKLTVGYGCRRSDAIELARSQKNGLSKADAERFLEEDLDVHRKLVQKHFANVPLTQGMFDAIVSWSFNTGALESFDANPAKQPGLHKHLSNCNYKSGLKELLKWVYYTRKNPKTGEPEKAVAKGLLRRRTEEYRLALKGIDENNLPQSIADLHRLVPRVTRNHVAAIKPEVPEA